MIKAKIEECLRLTGEIMTTHFQGNSELLYKHLHKKCLWIGANASEFYHGKKKICEVIEQVKKEMPKVTLTAKSFECIAHERNSCAIVGRYIGSVDKEEGVFRDMQRVTFLWREEKGKLWVWHMHVSNPLSLVEKNETFPLQVSLQTKEYLEMLKQERMDKEGSILIKNDRNVYVKIPLLKIIYIEGFDTNTIIHTTEEDILAKSLLAEIEKQMKSLGSCIIVRVHRSYMVNKFYVNSIKRYELEVASQYNVPISRGKYREIKEMLFVSGGEMGSE